MPLSALLCRASAFVRSCPPCVGSLFALRQLFVRSFPGFVPIIVVSFLKGNRLAAISLGRASGLCPLFACCGEGLSMALSSKIVWSVSLTCISTPQIRPPQAHPMLAKTVWGLCWCNCSKPSKLFKFLESSSTQDNF